MEIKLQRFGGMVPLKQEATTQVNWSDQELEQLIGHICRDEKKEPENMNEICHYLEVQGREIPVDLKKVPPKYKAIFEGLKTELKYVKA
ncbi:hypothetical protein [Dyadobacter frigoris]|uniref:Uncharacterized protein n=1 Tax=Dyadobacter frigoris TaxID=2576211 RepID=A0A4U6DHP0_9BACT|nr:hypothetical protein [Dyadobacter frigoris]TKT94234.1 hypothetical protein FDK13_03205 [Dyadobacter frigoris]GLU50575.1 hypothetical protein Dfri01_00360 [Dyadobacter frigoris]